MWTIAPGAVSANSASISSQATASTEPVRSATISFRKSSPLRRVIRLRSRTAKTPLDAVALAEVADEAAAPASPSDSGAATRVGSRIPSDGWSGDLRRGLHDWIQN